MKADHEYQTPGRSLLGNSVWVAVRAIQACRPPVNDNSHTITQLGEIWSPDKLLPDKSKPLTGHCVMWPSPHA